MPRAIVKQPNGRYAIWSTIVDNFLMRDAAIEDVITAEVNDRHYSGYPGGPDALRRDLCRELENIAETGRAWPWAPTWKEALRTIRELHGTTP